MQLHCLHANAAGFETRESDAGAESGRQADSVADALVVLVAVEALDGRYPQATARTAGDRIESVADQLSESTVLLVPYPQLSDDPADTALAETVFDALRGILDLDVRAAPVGGEFAFHLDARGHPLASQQYHVVADQPAGASEWFLLMPDGERQSVTPADLDDPKRTLLEAETAGESSSLTLDGLFGRVEGGPPVFESSSNRSGRLLPTGVVGLDLLLAFGADHLRSYGASAVEYVPSVSRTDGPSVQSGIATDEELSLADLPHSLFSTSQSVPTRSGAASDTLTLETAVTGTQAARDELIEQAALVHRILTEIGIEYDVLVRSSKDLGEADDEWLPSLVATLAQSVLLEQQKGANSHLLEIEFVISDGEGRRLATPSVTLAERIENEQSSAADSNHIVRSTPLGSPIRLLGAILHRAAAMDEPHLPTWLSPVQFRLIPIGDSHLSYCEQLAQQVAAAGIRVDIDDRDVAVSERLDAADSEWVPYDCVVGDEEVDGESLGVTVRAAQREREFTPGEFVAAIRADIEEWPQAQFPAPRRHSRRPSLSERN